MSTDVFVPRSAVASDEEWRRLSPRMLLVHPVKEIGRALPALVAVVFAGSSSGNGDLWGLAGAGIVIALAISRWYTTRYRVGADQVQIREGLLRRRTLSARLDRVRTVDVTSHALHRALGLARVEIGTGVSDRKGKSALRLDGLLAAEAAQLRGELLHRSAVAAPSEAGVSGTTFGGGPAPTGARPDAFVAAGLSAAADREVELARLDPGWIRFAPFTLSGVFTALAVAGFGWRIFSESHIDLRQVPVFDSAVHHVDGASLGLALFEAVVGIVVFIAAASTIRYVLAFWGFRLTRHEGGTFHVARGLLTTRATSIEVSRLRGVGISEPLLLRLVGGAKTVAIATGLEVGRGASASGRGGTVLLPDAPLAEARRVAGVVLAAPQIVDTPLTGHGAAATRRRYTRALGSAAAVVALTEVVWWVFDIPSRDWVFSLALLPLAIPLAFDRASNLGHAVRDGFLVRQSGSLVRRRTMLEADAIIGWNIGQSFFQRRAGVATLVATTAAGRQSYQLLDLTPTATRQVADACLPGLLDEFGCQPGRGTAAAELASASRTRGSDTSSGPCSPSAG